MMSSQAIAVDLDIQAWKRALAKRFATNLNGEFVKAYRNMTFSKPRRLDGRPTTSSSSCIRTASSAHEGTKRVNKILEFLAAFEEKCTIEGLMLEPQLRELRFLNRGVLGKVLENFTLFKHQHSMLIAINILMFNSSKMKIPKDSFKDLVSDLFQKSERKELTIHTIKKSKTYSMIKQVIRAQVEERS